MFHDDYDGSLLALNQTNYNDTNLDLVTNDHGECFNDLEDVASSIASTDTNLLVLHGTNENISNQDLLT